MLLSCSPQTPLIDWDFPPQTIEARIFNQRIDTVSLPTRFVGRRAELRRYKTDLLKGKLRKLLITGTGRTREDVTGGQTRAGFAGEWLSHLRLERAVRKPLAGI